MSPAAAAARASSRASAESWKTPAFAASLIHSAFMRSALGLAQANVQLAQLFFVRGRRRPREQVLRALGLWKGDDVADRFGARHHGHDAIQAEGDPAMGRCAVLERLQEEAEFLLCLLGADRERAEHLRL